MRGTGWRKVLKDERAEREGLAGTHTDLVLDRMLGKDELEAQYSEQ